MGSANRVELRCKAKLQHHSRPLLWGEHHPPVAAAKADQGGGMVRLGIEPLALGSNRLLAGGTGHIGPGSNLQHKAIEAVEITHVVLAASTELAANRLGEQKRKQLCRLALSAIAATLGAIGHRLSIG
jgi:hypothetical protein